MATINVTPQTINTAAQAAAWGDELVCAAGDYSHTPRAGLTYRAADHEVGKPLRGVLGHLGQGFACRWVSLLGGSFTDVKMHGFFYDGRETNGINYALLTGDRVELYDYCYTDRVPSGRRRIGFTVGDGPNTHDGFVAERFRHVLTGRPGDTHDHSFYIKRGGRGSRIRKGIIDRAGWFGVQLYPEALEWDMDELVIWGCGGGVVFSSESGNATVNLNGSARDCRLRNSIIGAATGRPGGQAGAAGYMVESYAASSVFRPSGNVVDNVNVYAAGGPSGRVQPGLVGVTVTNLFNEDPGFRDPANGDFTRTGTWDGRGPSELFGVTSPPPPPPPPPVDTTPPTLTWIPETPGDFARVTGPVRIGVTADEPVQTVTLSLSGPNLENLTFIERTAPYEREPAIDTTTLTDGTWTVGAYGEDIAGNISTTITRTWTVDNVPDEPPPPPPPDDCADVRAQLAAMTAERDSLRDLRDQALDERDAAAALALQLRAAATNARDTLTQAIDG